jgi:hypothetical protein
VENLLKERPLLFDGQQSGHFDFAPTGTFHFAATRSATRAATRVPAGLDIESARGVLTPGGPL